MFQVVKLLSGLFRFFASLKLAVVLLVLLGLALAVATFVESAQGTEAARRLVYQTGWFSGVLVILAVNVACAAFSRWPWKKRHVGFVITHAGIILILSGSLVTQKTGMEGQMALAEGETADYLLIDESVVEATVAGHEGEQSEPTYFNPETLRRNEPVDLGHDLSVSVLTYYRHALGSETISPYGYAPNPAVYFSLKGSQANVSHWLFAHDAGARSVSMGPAEVQFSDVKTREEFDILMGMYELSEKTGGMLILTRGDETHEILVEPNVGQTVPIGESGYHVTIKRYLPHALVEGSELVNRSNEPVNPACEILIEGEGAEEHHTLFSLFPDFPTLHGRAQKEGIFKATFVTPRLSSASGRKLLIIRAPEGELFYKITDDDIIKRSGSLKLGQPVETGWMDFMFTLEQYFPTALVEQSFEMATAKEDLGAYPPAAHIQMTRSGESTETWLQRGSQKTLFLGGHAVRLSFGLRRYPLNFSVELDDFEIGRYRGTENPSSFQSQVKLFDSAFAEPQDVLISMNHPMKHRGYTFFQASYREAPGQPDVSVFAVTKDPGIPLKYGGSIILVGGVITMFFTRRYKSRVQEVLNDSQR